MSVLPKVFSQIQRFGGSIIIIFLNYFKPSEKTRVGKKIEKVKKEWRD